MRARLAAHTPVVRAPPDHEEGMHSTRTFRSVIGPAIGLFLGLLIAGGPALAEQESLAEQDALAARAPATSSLTAGGTNDAERPWARGVSPAEQETALARFEEGNALLKDSLFAQAADKYREALAHWSHPRIHYNLALALMSLDQPIAVYENLEEALRYGADGLDPDKHNQARGYLALIGQQVARIEVRCDQPGAEVTLDGKLLFTGPGSRQTLVRTGEHRLVASKRGYLTASRPLTLSPGQELRVGLELLALDRVTESRRHWSAWKPWTVVGSGTALALAGGYLHWRSSQGFVAYDEGVAHDCDGGCPDGVSEALQAQRKRATLQQNLAIASYATGGAALVTGMVLAYVNRARVVRVDLTGDAEAASAAPAPAAITPMVSPGGLGASATFRF